METNSSIQELESQQAVLQELIGEKEDFMKNFPEQDEVRNVLWSQDILSQECQRLQIKSQKYYSQIQTCAKFIDMLTKMIASWDSTGQNPGPQQFYAIKKSATMVRKHSKEISKIVEFSIFPRVTTNNLGWIKKFGDGMALNATRAITVLKQRREKTVQQRTTVTASILNVEIKIENFRQEYRRRKEIHEQQLLQLRGQLASVSQKLTSAKGPAPTILQMDNLITVRGHNRKSSRGLNPIVEALEEKPVTPAPWVFVIMLDEYDQGHTLPEDYKLALESIRRVLDKQGYRTVDERIIYDKVLSIAYHRNTHQRCTMKKISREKFSGWNQEGIGHDGRLVFHTDEGRRIFRFCFYSKKEEGKVLA